MIIPFSLLLLYLSLSNLLLISGKKKTI